MARNILQERLWGGCTVAAGFVTLHQVNAQLLAQHGAADVAWVINQMPTNPTSGLAASKWPGLPQQSDGVRPVCCCMAEAFKATVACWCCLLSHDTHSSVPPLFLPRLLRPLLAGQPPFRTGQYVFIVDPRGVLGCCKAQYRAALLHQPSSVIVHGTKPPRLSRWSVIVCVAMAALCFGVLLSVAVLSIHDLRSEYHSRAYWHTLAKCMFSIGHVASFITRGILALLLQSAWLHRKGGSNNHCCVCKWVAQAGDLLYLSDCQPCRPYTVVYMYVNFTYV